MCGRFTLRPPWAEIDEYFRPGGPALNVRPRYNVAPGQDVAVVRRKDGGRRLSMLRWGLVPGWARDPRIGSRLVNARSETAAEKPAFRAAFRSRRCLVVADGFYEWAGRGRARRPWLFEIDGGALFAFAGLWERWTVPAGAVLAPSLAHVRPGEAIETCTILTTAANSIVAPVHHRMPVILPPASFDAWLANGPVPLAPFPADAMTARPVSSAVNSTAIDDPRCVEPATLL